MLNTVLWAVALAVFVTTLLPLSNSVQWWVRMWDFPRLHIGVVAFVALLIGLVSKASFKAALIGVFAAAGTYQTYQLFPYTGLATPEVALTSPPNDSDVIDMLAINVLMQNTRYDDLISIIDREDPDILLLMETDAAWADNLDRALGRYETIKAHIADDHYGMIFATRLDVTEAKFLWPVDDSTPSIKAILGAPNGPMFNFIGLHPRPPVPGNDTATRDRQIKEAALRTSSTERPTVVMGDFNDVSWSWTTKRFKRYGDFREPRVGRGMISSFHAEHMFMRFPIDQLFVTQNVGLVSFGRLEKFGSDHFPIIASVYIPQNRSAQVDR